MRFEDYECIRFERQGRILRIVLNRPGALNAVDEQLHHELATVFADAALDEESTVIVLTGEGRAFCAGGDVSMMERMRGDASLYTPQNVQGKRIVYSLLELEKPVICRLNGDAVGLGATIALLCDIILADEGARLSDPHVKVGLVAGDGGALIWPQLLGYARAKELLLTGDALTATRACELGLINHVHPTGELDAAVDALATRLANGATEAINWTKTIANLGLKQLMHSIMDAGMAYEALSMGERAHRDAVEAFLASRAAKRSPSSD